MTPTRALPFDIRNAQGERIDAVWRPAASAVPSAPVAPPAVMVVIGHGVTSHWDRPWQTGLSAALSAAGLASLLMSFAGNGASDGMFEAVTPTKEAADLGSVLDALQAWGVQRLAYVGHSMGGAVGVLRASTDPRIEAVVSLAGMFHVHDFMQRQFGHLVPGEGLMLDKPGCVWNRTLADDALRIGSLRTQAARVRVPWLLVHGDADELVPLRDSLDAQQAAGADVDLVVLPGVDHRFTDAVPAMTAAVVSWLEPRLQSR